MTDHDDEIQRQKAEETYSERPSFLDGTDRGPWDDYSPYYPNDEDADDALDWDDEDWDAEDYFEVLVEMRRLRAVIQDAIAAIRKWDDGERNGRIGDVADKLEAALKEKVEP